MDIVYKVAFMVGILYTFVSVILNGISGALHIGHDLGHVDGNMGGHSDVGGHSHVGDHSHGHVVVHSHGHTGDINSHSTHSGHDTNLQHSLLSRFSFLINPLVAVSFLTIFGGLGILGSEYFKWIAVLVFFVSLFSAVTVSFLLYKFIAIPLYKSENSTDVSREDLVSTPAEVVSPIIKGGFGKIKYVVNDIRYTAPAMHIDGESVEQGKTVVICKFDNNIFYVSEVNIL